MKTALVLAFGLMSTFAHANPESPASLSVDGGAKLFRSEIECVEKRADKSKIDCITNSPNLICSTSFTALLKNGGSKDIKIRSSGVAPRDSDLWQCISFGLTDKLNLALFRTELKDKIKAEIKEIDKIKNCN